MGTSRPRLKLVGRTPRKRMAGKPLECECGSRETVETRVDRRLENGRVTSGQKQYRCFHCGKIVH